MIDWLCELWKLREVFAADPVTVKLLEATTCAANPLSSVEGINAALRQPSTEAKAREKSPSG